VEDFFVLRLATEDAHRLRLYLPLLVP
jgi:hypothetical protein